MHICAQIVARVPPVELRGVIEDCSILTEHSLKGVAAYRSHNDGSPLHQRRQIRNARHQARLVQKHSANT